MICETRVLIVGFVFLLINVLFITGCTSVISKPVLNRVDRSITFQALRAQPEQFVGKMVLLGGLIVKATVKKEETLVEVVQKPLDGQKRPEDTDRNLGRFLILYQGFRDPVIYAPGKKITVAGEIRGKMVLPLNEIQYRYPVIIPTEDHVWKPEDIYGGPRFGIGIGVGVGL